MIERCERNVHERTGMRRVMMLKATKYKSSFMYANMRPDETQNQRKVNSNLIYVNIRFFRLRYNLVSLDDYRMRSIVVREETCLESEINVEDEAHHEMMMKMTKREAFSFCCLSRRLLCCVRSSFIRSFFSLTCSFLKTFRDSLMTVGNEMLNPFTES